MPLSQCVTEDDRESYIKWDILHRVAGVTDTMHNVVLNAIESTAYAGYAAHVTIIEFLSGANAP